VKGLDPTVILAAHDISRALTAFQLLPLYLGHVKLENYRAASESQMGKLLTPVHRCCSESRSLDRDFQIKKLDQTCSGFQ
jgi:hypothetical protein